MDAIAFLAALGAALSGSFHCAGMCGGFVLAASGAGRRPPSCGVNVGAGLSWRLSRDTALFGSYRFMQSAREGILSHGDRSSESDFAGHDVLYGISVRF